MKFKAIKEVPSTLKGWEDFETIPQGTICETEIFDRVDTIKYKGKFVCDCDSELAKDYFKEIR